LDNLALPQGMTRPDWPKPAGSAAGFFPSLGTGYEFTPEEIMNIMSATNPFQVPSCLQQADHSTTPPRAV
jgi:hypothetical protein